MLPIINCKQNHKQIEILKLHVQQLKGISFFFSYTVDSLKKITIIIIINKGSLIMQSTGNNLQALSLIKVGGLVLFGKEKQSTC